MDNNIWWAWRGRAVIARRIEMSSESIKDLTRACEVSFQRENIYFEIWEGNKVQIKDLIAFFEEIWDYMSAGLSTTAREDYAFTTRGCRDCVTH